MNLEEESKPSETLLQEKKRLEDLISMSEPFERLLENPDYQKVLGFYAKSAEYYGTKIGALCNDLANDSNETETTVNRHYRVANVISRAVVARDTLSRVATEPKEIVDSAREAHKRIEEINSIIKENEPMPDDKKDPALEVLEKVKADADAKAKADSDAKSSNDAASKKDLSDKKGDANGAIDPAVREQIKKVRGWNDSQLDAELRTAPLQEKLARYEIKEKYGDFDKYKDDFAKEIEKYAIFDRTPQLMEQVLWMVKGKNMTENPPKEDDKDPDVVARRIHSPYPSSASGSSSGSSGKVSKLSNEEKQMAYLLGVPEERYEASKKGDPDRVSPRFIRKGPELKAPANGNAADHQLGILLGKRR